MYILIFLQNKYSTNHKFESDWIEIIIILFLVIVLTIISQKIKSKRIGFEEKIIQTISKNRIIDQNFFDGLSSENMKINIRQEIIKLNNKSKIKFIDLQKMEKLMEELTFDNLQKSYQWFFYKGSS